MGNKSLAEINSQKEMVSMLLDDDDEDVGGNEGFGRSAAFKTGFGNPSFEDEDEDGGFFGNQPNGKKTKSGTETPNIAAAGAVDVSKKRGRKSLPASEKKKPTRKKAEGAADGEPKAKRVRKTSTAAGKKLALTPSDTPASTTPDV